MSQSIVKVKLSSIETSMLIGTQNKIIILKLLTTMITFIIRTRPPKKEWVIKETLNNRKWCSRVNKSLPKKALSTMMDQ